MHQNLLPIDLAAFDPLSSATGNSHTAYIHIAHGQYHRHLRCSVQAWLLYYALLSQLSFWTYSKQNFLAHAIVKAPKFYTPIVKSLHWLKSKNVAYKLQAPLMIQISRPRYVERQIQITRK